MASKRKKRFLIARGETGVRPVRGSRPPIVPEEAPIIAVVEDVKVQKPEPVVVPKPEPVAVSKPEPEPVVKPIKKRTIKPKTKRAPTKARVRRSKSKEK